jgi:hypothetical protein
MEMGWNYAAPDPDAMQRLAACFLKVDRHLEALQEWERRESGPEAMEPAALAAAGRAARSYERAKSR